MLTDEEYALVVQTMEDFQKNEGPKLQSVLEQRYITLSLAHKFGVYYQ